MHYTKLFSSIIHSTIWREQDHVRLVWITMLAMKERDGTVQTSLPGLADAARVTMPECQEAVARLEGPDLYSRNPERDGRRIEPCEGGWRLLNAEYYRKKLNEDDRREYRRQWAQENRKESKAVNRKVDKHEQMLTDSTQSESESESESKKKNYKNNSKRKSVIPPDFELTEKRKGLALNYWAKRGVTRDVEVTWDKFKAHHEGRGTMWVDWDKAWQTWYVAAIDLGRPPGGMDAQKKRDKEARRLPELKGLSI